MKENEYIEIKKGKPGRKYKLCADSKLPRSPSISIENRANVETPDEKLSTLKINKIKADSRKADHSPDSELTHHKATKPEFHHIMNINKSISSLEDFNTLVMSKQYLDSMGPIDINANILNLKMDETVKRRFNDCRNKNSILDKSKTESNNRDDTLEKYSLKIEKPSHVRSQGRVYKK